jgi:hypothetical protein
MSDDQVGAEGVFSMDPDAVLWALARQLVDEGRVLAEMGRTAAHSSEALPDIPEVLQFAASYERLRHNWYENVLPSIAAGMRLAIEVFDTYGSGHTEVKDNVEAAMWNNKYHVWVAEFRDGTT